MDIRKKLNNYLKENLEEERSMSFAFAKRKALKEENMMCGAAAARSYMCMDECAEAPLSDFINNELDENKFQKLLFKYIDDRGLKDSDVYNKANIDRRLFSKIRSDEDYHPSKETIISLATSLELNINELEELLDSASYSLPKNNKFDLIIRFCFLEKIYNIIDINNLLDEHKCHLL